MKPLHLKTAAAAALLALGGAAVQAAQLSEGFDGLALPAGWSTSNNSDAPGGTWFAGNSGIFPAQAGAAGSYMADNFLRSASGKLDDWLITPQFDLLSGGTLSFWARSNGGFADALRVLFNPTGDTDPTHFSVVALSINPTEADPGSPGAFPTDWTLFTYDYAGGGSGRFAFEYLVSDVAVAGDYIGIDTVSTTAAAASGVAEPASLVLVMAAVVGLAATRRRRESED